MIIRLSQSSLAGTGTELGNKRRPKYFPNVHKLFLTCPCRYYPSSFFGEETPPQLMVDVVKIRLVSPIELGLGLSLAIKEGPKYFPNVQKLFLTPIKPCLCQFDSIFILSRDV